MRKKQGSVISWCDACQENHKNAPCPPAPVNPPSPTERRSPHGAPRIDRKPPSK